MRAPLWMRAHLRLPLRDRPEQRRVGARFESPHAGQAMRPYLPRIIEAFAAQHSPRSKRVRVVRFSTLQYRKYVSDGDPAAEEYRSRPPAMHGVDTTQRYRLFLLTYPGTVAGRNVASRRRCYAMSDFDEAIDKENLDLAAIADECRKEAGDDIGRAADIMTERVKKSDPP